MATFSGVIYDVLELQNRGGYYYIPSSSTSTVTAFDPGDGLLLGTVQKSIIEDIHSVRNAKIYDAYEDAMMNTIYLVPKAIDAGFIVEDQAHEIKLWNAYRTTKILSSLISVSPAGTTLSLTAPKTMPTLTILVHQLTINKVGQPIQNTQYIYTIDSITYTLAITGKRIEAWRWLNNWVSGVEITLQFATVVWENELYNEQRRPLRETYSLKQTASFLRARIEAQKFTNDLKTLQPKVLGIPIFVSSCIVQNNLAGSTTITVLENLADDRFFQRSSFVMIFDLDNIEAVEIKEVSSYSTSVINLVNSVIGDFKALRTVVFPAFFGRLENNNFTAKSGSLINSQLTFREMDF